MGGCENGCENAWLVLAVGMGRQLSRYAACRPSAGCIRELKDNQNSQDEYQQHAKTEPACSYCYSTQHNAATMCHPEVSTGAGAIRRAPLHNSSQCTPTIRTADLGLKVKEQNAHDRGESEHGAVLCQPDCMCGQPRVDAALTGCTTHTHQITKHDSLPSPHIAMTHMTSKTCREHTLTTL